MSLFTRVMFAVVLSMPAMLALAEAPFDAASAFGARESVADLSLSPDGMSVAYISPNAGQGNTVYVRDLSKGTDSPSVKVAIASGKPERYVECHWVSNKRLICRMYGVVASGSFGLLPFSRLIAVNSDGTNNKMLAARTNENSKGYQLSDGTVIDWLPEENGAVLMSRNYVADEHLGSHLGGHISGLGVDWINTVTLDVRSIEAPHESAQEYITDGRGTLRVMGVKIRNNDARNYDSGEVKYLYRREGSQAWEKFPDVVSEESNGFDPIAVDHDRNIAYGFKKHDGRLALYSMALDGSLKEELIYSRPDVDVGNVVQIGPRQRVIGITYADDFTHYTFFDPTIEQLLKSLAKALPDHPSLTVIDSSVDENKLLLMSGSDQDPGVYYLFDKAARKLETFFVVRRELEGVKLAVVKPVSYPAADGTKIPGYLTLPPGVTDPKGLPAIVMPHGGPAYRDVWGFDWLAQFYAARGYAVLQPNFRGSWGYGDDWYQKNGFQSWSIAIGDVLDAGRWLVSQGIANPAKLAIVGWSYGGYAALQSAVVDPGLFKAVVAIAPVTDLPALKESFRDWSSFTVESRYIGDGPQIREGSPALNAAKIKVPVLLFQGEHDITVPIRQSREMADRLASAGVAHELVTWPILDHQLEDSAARAEMLRKSDAFLRHTMGMD
jgi:acetyl esterase/lipase